MSKLGPFLNKKTDDRRGHSVIHHKVSHVRTPNLNKIIIAAMGESALEALERAVAEIEALQAIYDEDFVVKSTSELTAATEAIEKGQAIEVLLQVCLRVNDALKLRCSLPPGYPVMAAVRVSVEGMTRKDQDTLTRQIQETANELVGQEAILQLVHELQEMAGTIESASITEISQESNVTESATCMTLSRRWVWAHHITDTARRKSIVQEARDLKLGGYLKSGYPGIVVVEGNSTMCDEFVNWIKGSKSRPGGFGRNWGHHVKGEVEITSRQLPLEFTELEDMRDLGAACKEHGLEEEFLEYVMQHKGSGD